jgi:hypothetical protein
VDVQSVLVGVAGELLEQRLDERLGRGRVGNVAGQKLALVGVERGGDGITGSDIQIPPWEAGGAGSLHACTEVLQAVL